MGTRPYKYFLQFFLWIQFTNSHFRSNLETVEQQLDNKKYLENINDNEVRKPDGDEKKSNNLNENNNKAILKKDISGEVHQLIAAPLHNKDEPAIQEHIENIKVRGVKAKVFREQNLHFY